MTPECRSWTQNPWEFRYSPCMWYTFIVGQPLGNSVKVLWNSYLGHRHLCAAQWPQSYPRTQRNNPRLDLNLIGSIMGSYSLNTRSTSSPSKYTWTQTKRGRLSNKFWPNPKTTADRKQVNLLLGSSSSLPAKNAENNSNVKVYLNKLNANKKQKKNL